MFIGIRSRAEQKKYSRKYRSPMRTWLTALAAVGLMLPIFGHSTVANADEVKNLHHVTFAVADPSLSVSTAPYSSLPIALGFWKKEGLSVEIQPVSGGNAGVQAVGTGNAFMTETGMTSIYPGLLRDPNMRIPAVHKNLYFVVVANNSSIHTAKELKGKNIGVQALSAASYYYGRAVVEAAGLDPDKDVHWIPVGVGFQAAAAEQNGTIDAYAGYDSINAKFGQLLHKKLRVIPSPLNDMPGMLGWLVSKNSFDKKPDEVAGMLKGIFESMVWAQANPEAAIKIHWKMFPASKPTNVSDEIAMKNAMEILTDRINLVYLPKGMNGLIGYADLNEVQKTADFMAKNRFLKNPIQVKDFIDFSLLKKANDFDRAKIEREAKNYHAGQ